MHGRRALAAVAAAGLLVSLFAPWYRDSVVAHGLHGLRTGIIGGEGDPGEGPVLIHWVERSGSFQCISVCVCVAKIYDENYKMAAIFYLLSKFGNKSR